MGGHLPSHGESGPGHGWISQALPSPQVGTKQKSGREGPIRRRERASALGCRSTWLRGTNGFPHAPPVAPKRDRSIARGSSMTGRGRRARSTFVE